MNPRRVIPLAVAMGASVLVGCSLDWNTGPGAADAGTSTTPTSSSSSSSGATTRIDSGTTPPATNPTNGDCGNNCVCKQNQNCDFTCSFHRTCKLTCQDASSCKFTCPTGSTCEIACTDNASCNFNCESGSQCISTCQDQPLCKGTCAVGADCTNDCGRKCDVQCAGIFGGSTQCDLKQ